MLFHRDLVSIGCPKAKATTLTARRFRLSAATVDRYRAKTKGVPEGKWLEALWPQYVGRTARAPMSPEAWRALVSSYTRPDSFARSEFKQCVERIRAVARLQGWRVPSTRTLQRRFNVLLTQLQKERS